MRKRTQDETPEMIERALLQHITKNIDEQGWMMLALNYIRFRGNLAPTTIVDKVRETLLANVDDMGWAILSLEYLKINAELNKGKPHKIVGGCRVKKKVVDA